MRKFFRFFVFIIFFQSSLAYGKEVYYKFQLNDQTKNYTFFQVVHEYSRIEHEVDGYKNNIQKQFMERKIFVRGLNDGLKSFDKFKEENFFDNDYIALNDNEVDIFQIVKKLKVYKEQLVPCMIKRGVIEKIPALCRYDQIKELYQVNKRDLSEKKLLKYSNNKQITIMYALLPRDRTKHGRLLIKHNGKFLKEENKIWEIPILGLSRKEAANSSDRRITSISNTPQGIYLIYGIMNNPSNPRLGLSDYINIDYGFVPINRFSDTSFIIDKLIPEKHQNDYWVNEFVLANAFGRSAIRLHDNDKSNNPTTHVSDGITFHLTNGCISTKDNAYKIVSFLRKAGFLNKTRNSNKNQKSIEDINKVGNVFLIVKDVD